MDSILFGAIYPPLAFQGFVKRDTLEELAEVKKTVVATLGTATLPNWHSKGATWRKAVSKKGYEKMAPPETWPQPLLEDDQDSELEEKSLDDGESKLKNGITRVLNN